MSNLFIANLSQQHHMFTYTTAKGGQTPRSELIQVGQQIRIPGSLSEEAVRFIIEHHRKYGLKSAVEAAKIRGYTGLVFSLNEPVKLNDKGFVEEVIDKNKEVLTEKADDLRATTTDAIAENLRNIGSQSGAPLQRAEVQTMEETNGTPEVNSGVEAVSEGVAPRNAGRARRAAQQQDG